MSHHHKETAYEAEESMKNRVAIVFAVGAVFLIGVILIAVGLSG